MNSFPMLLLHMYEMKPLELAKCSEHPAQGTALSLTGRRHALGSETVHRCRTLNMKREAAARHWHLRHKVK